MGWWGFFLARLLLFALAAAVHHESESRCSSQTYCAFVFGLTGFAGKLFSPWQWHHPTQTAWVSNQTRLIDSYPPQIAHRHARS